MPYLLVGLGGAIGAVLRYAFGRLGMRFLPPDLPFSILLVNILGSSAMGLLVGYGARHAMSEEMRLFLAIGVLGGFTTFSSFSLDTVVLLQRGAFIAAGAYVALSVMLSILGLFAGLALMRGA